MAGQRSGTGRCSFGETPWGYRLSDYRTKLVVDEDERITTVVRHMKVRGPSIRQIVAELEAMGIVGRRGTPIGPTRVFEMIHRGRAKRRRRSP